VDFRIATSLIWGIAVLVLFSYILGKRWNGYRQHRDRRARRDFVESLALFFTAAPAAGSIFAYLILSIPNAASSLLGATALGAFVGLGIIMATEETARHNG
jgi:putative flippase GtrA